MKAVIIEKPGEVSVKEIPYPKPGPGEITIKIKTCGVCATDYHIFSGEFLADYPLIPGHEISGIVEELGEGVYKPEVGTSVAIDPGIFCGSCYFCKTNRGNHCLDWKGLGVTQNGGFAEYMVAPQENVYPVSDNLSFEEASFIEPVSCIVYGLNRLKINPGSDVLIFGAGPIGLQLAQLIQYGNAASVSITDINPKNLEIANKVGIKNTFLAGNDYGKVIKDLYPLGHDVVIDATGIASVAEESFEYIKRTGKIMFFGVCLPEDKIEISPYEIYEKDLEIYGSFALCYTFYQARNILENKVIKVKPLVSDYIGLDDLPMILKDKGLKKDSLKILLRL